MKNRIDRTSENLAEMRALLRRYRKGRLDQLELEPENYCWNVLVLIATSRLFRPSQHPNIVLILGVKNHDQNLTA